MVMLLLGFAMLMLMPTWRDDSRRKPPRGSQVAPQVVAVESDVGLLVSSEGSLWCWGGTVYKTLLVEEPAEGLQRIGRDSDWLSVAARHFMAAGLKTNGTLWYWGWNGFEGDARPWNLRRILVPTRFGKDKDWVQVAASMEHCLALKGDGSLWAWGRNEYGLLGNGTTNDQLTPTQVGRDLNWRSIAAGGVSSFGLKTDGTLWAWGNLTGTKVVPTPAPIDTRGDVVAISAADFCVLALRADGTLWAAGRNAHVLASTYIPGPTNVLVRLGGDCDWNEVRTGGRTFFAHKRDGTWWVGGILRFYPGALPVPRPLAFQSEPWSLSPGLGDALVYDQNGNLSRSTIYVNTNLMTKLKMAVNRWGQSFGHTQFFSPRNFPLQAVPTRVYEMPPELSSKR